MHKGWRPSAGAALALVLGLLAIGMVLYLLRHERAGGLVVAITAEAGALLRAALPAGRARLLTARSRWFDTAFLALLGLAILLGDLADVYRTARG